MSTDLYLRSERLVISDPYLDVGQIPHLSPGGIGQVWENIKNKLYYKNGNSILSYLIEHSHISIPEFESFLFNSDIHLPINLFKYLSPEGKIKILKRMSDHRHRSYISDSVIESLFEGIDDREILQLKILPYKKVLQLSQEDKQLVWFHMLSGGRYFKEKEIAAYLNQEIDTEFTAKIFNNLDKPFDSLNMACMIHLLENPYVCVNKRFKSEEGFEAPLIYFIILHDMSGEILDCLLKRPDLDVNAEFCGINILMYTLIKAYEKRDLYDLTVGSHYFCILLEKCDIDLSFRAGKSEFFDVSEGEDVIDLMQRKGSYSSEVKNALWKYVRSKNKVNVVNDSGASLKLGQSPEV